MKQHPPQRIIVKHRLVIRLTHWANVPILAVMIWSGLLIYWANDVYVIGVGRHVLLNVPPGDLLKKLHMDHRLAEGMAWHFVFAWPFVLIGVCYVVYTVASGHWRELIPGRHSLRDAWRVVLHDLHIRKTAPPTDKYNAAQKIAYTGIVAAGAGSVLTGLAIYKPVQLGWLTTALGGYDWTRWEHFWLMMSYLGFVVIHVAQVAKTGWNNFRSMVAGHEIVLVAKESHAAGQPAT